MSEIFGVHGMVVALVALLVIGPKDLPKAMRVVGYWVGRARAVARQFRSGFDEIVREAELEEMEKRWAKENERIMREHPPTADAEHASVEHASVEHGPMMTPLPHPEDAAAPVHVEKPVVAPAPDTPAPHPPRGDAAS